MNHSILNMFLTKGILNNKLKRMSFSDGSEEDNKDENVNQNLKNVCARLPEYIANDLDNVCSELSCSKRQFIEAAITNALSEYRSLAYEYDMTGEREEREHREAYDEYISEQIEKGNFDPETGEWN